MCFLSDVLIFEYFWRKLTETWPTVKRKEHAKFESIVIIKLEERLVLMEGIWYLSLPALLKHVCTNNFVQDAAISIKIVGKFRYNCGILELNFQSKMLKTKEVIGRNGSKYCSKLGRYETLHYKTLACRDFSYIQ